MSTLINELQLRTKPLTAKIINRNGFLTNQTMQLPPLMRLVLTLPVTNTRCIEWQNFGVEFEAKRLLTNILSDRTANL